MFLPIALLMMNLNDFSEIVRFHQNRYPQMKPRDYIKLAYQSEFGPEHLVTDKERVLSYLRKEWEEINETDEPCRSEPIGNGLFRFYLGKVDNIESSSSLLADLFMFTAKEHEGSKEGLLSRLDQLKNFSIPGMDDFLSEYESSNYPAVHHSQEYRDLYHPHYRLLSSVYAYYFSFLNEIQSKLQSVDKKPLIISIDGLCGSGKTYLSQLIQRLFSCNVFHVDDYYLPISKRKENWEQIPGGNIDFDRFINEVIKPAANNEPVSYQPYVCRTGTLKEAEQIQPLKLVIVEGSYSGHPLLQDYYDYKIFMNCSKYVQEKRLRKREGDYFSAFEKRWIPLEHNYFRTYNIQQKSDLVLDTTEFD
ncbi:hypothetical protein M9Y10_014325 [Tritrichomonas musculus]|uniref:Uridine kinase n=1 Tax=Tritrichomonas musculus TaxID=1915356 RepID=A0ABR2KZ77_9EUKA